MPSLGAASVFGDVADALALLVLLTQFAMLRAPLSRSQVRLYSFQSLVVTALALAVAARYGLDDLYAIAGLTFVLKVVLVPGIILRLLRDAGSELAGSNRLGVATMVLIGIVVSVFGFFTVGGMHFHSATLPAAALGLSVAEILVAFLIVILRSDVVSQAVGFFSLENGVSVASLVVASGIPLVIEVAFFFDLVVAVVVFGVLMRVHHRRTDTLSTLVLDRLKG